MQEDKYILYTCVALIPNDRVSFCTLGHRAIISSNLGIMCWWLSGFSTLLSHTAPLPSRLRYRVSSLSPTVLKSATASDHWREIKSFH